MEKIVKTQVEYGVMTVTLKNGTKIPVKAKTTYTYWSTGRKDCHIDIEKPVVNFSNTGSAKIKE